MKSTKILASLLLVLSSWSAFAQTVTVSSNPAAATLAVNCETSSRPVKVKAKQAGTGVLAFMDGYNTNGVLAADLKAAGESDYSIKLEKKSKLATGGTLKKISFTKLIDLTNKLNQVTYLGAYRAAIPSIDVTEPKYGTLINTAMTGAGYKMVGTNNLFSGKSDVPDLAFGGEILWYSKDTKGRGFQVGLLVHWSVYSVENENIVFETTTGGWSNSGIAGPFADEFTLCLKDALAGLMFDSRFQELVAKKKDAAVSFSDGISIPKNSLKKFSSYSAVVKESVGSVVTIKTDFGIGSGFIISENGYILTNNHVIQSAEKIEVVFDNGFSFEAKMIRANAEKDVALLKMQGSGFKPLVLNPTDELASTGSEVIAIGTPENIKLGQTVTKGIVSGKRELDEKIFLQTDVAINSGNSGGPLINTTTGEVIGIVAAKIKAKGVEGLGFAIPISEAIKALNLKFE